MKAKIWILTACFICLATTVTRAAGAVKIIKIVVQCTCDDTAGRRLCLALKEKIRSSKSFEPVEEREAETSPQGFGVHLVSEDIEEKGSEFANLHSAVAVAFTLPSRHMEGFINLHVVVVGIKSVDEEASDLLADIDHDSDFLRNLPN